MQRPATQPLGALCIGLLLCSAPASAQLAPGASPTLTKDADLTEEIVQLSPFAVTAQSGWSANDTLWLATGLSPHEVRRLRVYAATANPAWTAPGK